jgi:hypothetical protein
MKVSVPAALTLLGSLRARRPLRVRGLQILPVRGRHVRRNVSLGPVPQIAVEGCMHGELDKVYDTLRRLEEAEGIKIDLLLCCGDFQVGSPSLNCWFFLGTNAAFA